MSVKDKRALYGKRNRIAVGGKTNGQDDKAGKRKDTDMEPVFWWTLCLEFYEELIHRFFINHVIDLTPGAGMMAEASIRNRVTYFGVAFTELHQTELIKRMELAALRAMRTEGTAIYNPKCAQAFAPPSTNPAPTPKHTDKKRKAASAKSGGKAAKAPVQEANDGGNSAGSHSSWDFSDDEK